MNTKLHLGIITLLFFIFSIAACNPYHMHDGMMERDDYDYMRSGTDAQKNWNYCPFCGSHMDRRSGYNMGHGMYTNPTPQKPLTDKDAENIIKNYLQSRRNPNLKTGKITEKDDYFEADILTRDGSLADKIKIDKNTGRMRSAY